MLIVLRRSIQAQVRVCRYVSRGLRFGSVAALCLLFGTSVPGLSQQVSSASASPHTGSLDAAHPASEASTNGAVSGIVLGPGGAVVTGANVTLSSGNSTSRSVTTDANGRFQFVGVPPGGFTVSVSLQGFDTATVSGTLQAGQAYAVAPIALHLATVSVVVDAVASPDDLALEQVHAEEKQRLLGVLPNFFVSYNWSAPPLTPREKFALATKNAMDPGNLLLVGVVAGEQQAQNAFPGYGQGAQGYGKRYGADLANLVAGTYMGGAVLPTIFRQDPRYFYKGTGSIKSRFWYAVSRAFICRGDNGKWQPAFASVLGDLSAGAISNIYYPASDRQGAALTLENGFLGVAGDAMNDVFQEFFLKKLTPKIQSTTSNTAQ